MRRQDRRAEIRCKAVLAALLLLGAALLCGGIWGNRRAEEASFSQENAFSLTGTLSGNLDSLWRGGIRPALEASVADPGKAAAACREQAAALWPEGLRGRLRELDFRLANGGMKENSSYLVFELVKKRCDPQI